MEEEYSNGIVDRASGLSNNTIMQQVTDSNKERSSGSQVKRINYILFY